MKVASHSWFQTAPEDVHQVLSKHLLADGFDMVFDPEASHSAWLKDAKSSDEYLDLFSFFASLPIGFNHPGLKDEAYLARLHQAAAIKPVNSDVYTQAMADFVSTFSRTLPKGFEHLFFIEGGALAVENALKAAFDWKVRKNIQAGRSSHLGSKVIHFKGAFHGRSGYTLSLTNTFDPTKTMYFPTFDWPRVTRPGRIFPETPENLATVHQLEKLSLHEIKEAVQRYKNDVACIIIETIQGEGGDVHFRTEYLQALRDICDEHEIVLIFDEVQAGMGITGQWWAFENQGVMPDIFSFGKKTQVCGVAATNRFDEIDSVWKVSSRINSTWGGNLVDMVRCQRYIEIIEQDNLLENARDVGAYALQKLEELSHELPHISNVRGRGLMCAFDLRNAHEREAVRHNLLNEQKVMMLASGEKTLRFRPVLDFTKAHVDAAVTRIGNAIRSL